jgi:hypothetical protein
MSETIGQSFLTETMTSWGSYPSIYNLGHRAIANLLDGPVLVEEKVDGSQFSFGKDFDGALRVRSKGAVMYIDAPEKMFNKAIAAVGEVAHLLVPGWTYRGEYLAKPKHNTLAYDRVPRNHIIIFDINTGLQTYLDHATKAKEASRLGFETVPLLACGTISSLDTFRGFLDQESILGGQKIEGVVVKPFNYDLLGQDKKVLFGKFVSEHFKEVHQRTWKEEHATKGSNDILAILAQQYTTPARWAKAVQHLAEAGLIEDSPKDIGKLMAEVPQDVAKECEEEIKEQLYKWAWPQMRRLVTRGLPEWYKEQLLKKQFDQ